MECKVFVYFKDPNPNTKEFFTNNPPNRIMKVIKKPSRTNWEKGKHKERLDK